MRRRFLQSNGVDSYMYIYSLVDGLTFSFSSTIEYRVNNASWVTLQSNTESDLVNIGDKIYIRGLLNPTVNSGIGTFQINGRCKIGGNVMSLLFGDFFKGKTDLTSKAFALTSLFRGCASITEVSSDFLPATTLAECCYNSMFSGCTSLVNAPELPATTLASNCYYNMFSGCTNLNYIKMLATNISAYRCLYNWVYNVSSTGTFVKNKNATWNTTPGALGTSGVPAGWTVVNDGEESEEGKLISFTIDGTSYQAEHGMTWAEWVSSGYNTGDFVVYYNNIQYGTRFICYKNNFNAVFKEDTIEPVEYILLFSDGGAD